MKQKLLPGSVIRQAAEERIVQMESMLGHQGDRRAYAARPQRVKRLSFLEVLERESSDEVEDERFDIAFALMTGELSRMLADPAGRNLEESIA